MLLAVEFEGILTVFPEGMITSSETVGTPFGVQLFAIFHEPFAPVYVFCEKQNILQEYQNTC